jgi:hypothetical protein
MLELDAAINFHLQADYYRQYLNKILKFDFPVITKEATAAYLKKVVGRAIRRLTTETDVIALISVIGELVKAEVGGQWFMIDRLSFDEPYHTVYEPAIRTSQDTVFLISTQIFGMVKWKVTTIENIFISARDYMTVPIRWAEFAKDSPGLLLVE